MEAKARMDKFVFIISSYLSSHEHQSIQDCNVKLQNFFVSINQIFQTSYTLDQEKKALELSDGTETEITDSFDGFDNLVIITFKTSL